MQKQVIFGAKRKKNIGALRLSNYVHIKNGHERSVCLQKMSVSQKNVEEKKLIDQNLVNSISLTVHPRIMLQKLHLSI